MQCYCGAIIRLQMAWRHRLACTGKVACRPAMKHYRPWQTTDNDDVREQNSTAPATLQPVINCTNIDLRKIINSLSQHITGNNLGTAHGHLLIFALKALSCNKREWLQYTCHVTKSTCKLCITNWFHMFCQQTVYSYWLKLGQQQI